MVTNRILAAAALVLVSTAPSFAKYRHPGDPNPPDVATSAETLPSPLSAADPQAAPDPRAPTPAPAISLPAPTASNTPAPLHDRAWQHEQG